MVHVVAAKTGTHELLEQVSLFVAALGAAEAGKGLFAVGVAQALELAGGQFERFIPRCFPEHGGPIGRVAVKVFKRLGVFWHTRFADQRDCQALGAGCIVKTETPFDAQTAVVRRAIAPVHADNGVALDVIGEQAAHATERADRIDLFVHHLGADLRLGHQRTGGAGLHAFAAGHAGAVAHRVGQIKNNSAVATAEGVSDHVVDLLLAAGAYAAVALDAGIEVDRHGGVGNVGFGLFAAQGLEFRAHGNAHLGCPSTEFAVLLRLRVLIPLVAHIRHVG